MYTLMVVDDDEVTRSAIQRYILKSFPEITTVWTAQDGQDAFAQYEEHRPDFLYTDIAMPCMDGLELIERLHQNGYHPRIVILSAHQNFAYAQNAIRLGVKDYLIKPILPMRVHEITEKLLEEQTEQDRLLRDLEMLKSRHQQTLPVLRERFFHSLIHPRQVLSNAESILEHARLVDIDLAASLYTVAILRIAPKSQHHARNLLVERFAAHLYEVAGSIFPPELRVYDFFAGRPDLVLILLSDIPDAEKMFRYANTALNALLKSAQKSADISMTGALGRLYHDVTGISSAYGDALLVLGSAQHDPADVALANFQDIASDKQISLQTATLEEGLFQSVKHHTYEQCIPYIEEMAEILCAFSRKNFEYAQTYFLKVAVLIWRDLQNANDGQVQFAVDFEALLATQNMDHCLLWLKSFLYQVIKAYAQLNQGRGSTFIDKAKRIMRENLSNSDFSIDDVSSRLYISSAYLRQLFKQWSDESFVEYLTRIRLEKALWLLQHTELKIHEIAEQTGFSNQQYFAVCFKKRYGKTPSEMRA